MFGAASSQGARHIDRDHALQRRSTITAADGAPENTECRIHGSPRFRKSATLVTGRWSPSRNKNVPQSGAHSFECRLIAGWSYGKLRISGDYSEFLAPPVRLCGGPETQKQRTIADDKQLESWRTDNCGPRRLAAMVRLPKPMLASPSSCLNERCRRERPQAAVAMRVSVYDDTSTMQLFSPRRADKRCLYCLTIGNC